MQSRSSQMKKIVFLFLGLYFLLAALLLPKGNFSELANLPGMYKHCQSEDKDLNIFAFITDHLLNIDGLFDEHKNGDEQKPHAAPPYHHSHVINAVYMLPTTKAVRMNFETQVVKTCLIKNDKKPTNLFSNNIYKPPIA